MAVRLTADLRGRCEQVRWKNYRSAENKTLKRKFNTSYSVFLANERTNSIRTGAVYVQYKMFPIS